MQTIREGVGGGKVIYHRNEQGQLHREDGPAVISEQYYAWHINGEHHRTNGPAIVYSYSNENKGFSYYVHNIALDDEHFEWCRENNIDKDNFSDEDVILFLMKFEK